MRSQRLRAFRVAAATIVLAATLCCASAFTQNPPPALSNATSATGAAPPEQAGSIVLAVGTVSDTAINDSVRQLHDGDPIYSGDTIDTGDDSYADLNFEDGGRMLLHPDTQFRIEQYHYDPAAHGYALAPPAQPSSYSQTIPAAASAVAAPAPTVTAPASASSAPAQPEHESAVFQLLKGSLSAISGFIGHVQHQDYAVKTPVATIGIRGTGYELRYCERGCAAGKRGLYTGVGSGTIAVSNRAGESLTSAGHYGYVQNGQTLFRHLQYPPRALQHMRLPQRFRARDARKLRLIQQRRVQAWRHRAAFGLHSRSALHAYRYSATNGLRRPEAANAQAQARHPLRGKKARHLRVRRHHRGPGRG